METARKLLSAALDPGGFICITGLKPKRAPIQRFFNPGDFDGAIAAAKKLCDDGMNPYFATSTFMSNSSRKADNVHAVKVLKLDLDVGTEKPYAKKKDAVKALYSFAEEIGMPEPTLVDSGNGVHVYWILQDALESKAAKILLEKFKAVTIHKGLAADPTTTADTARILRVPGTTNYKNENNPKPVKLMSDVVEHDTDDIVEKIENAYKEIGFNEPAAEDSLFEVPTHVSGAQIDDTTRVLLGGKPKKFSIILKRAGGESGCAQIKQIYDQQEFMDEPRWRAGLSIAHFCEDGEEAIHTISSKYPEYDNIQTIRKAEKILGPYTCETFKSNWPAFCDGCKLAGKITSPIQTGDYVPRATAADNVVLAKNNVVDSEEVAYTIPTYPFPYFRGKNGGVYMQVSGDDEGEPPIEVYKYDFYMVKRLRDKDDGYHSQFRVHHPKDGVIEFTMPTADIGSTDKLRDSLNRNGIMVFDKEVPLVRAYIRRWFDVMANEKEVDMVKTQYGWTEGFKSFVIGEREIKEHTITYSPTAPSMAAINAMFARPSGGDLLEWRKIINTYAKPGFESYAVGSLFGFAAPLLAISNSSLAGYVVNLFSTETGIGKSTIQQVIMSIWGNPGHTMLLWKDTAAARYHRMGVYKNIPVCVDEATKATAEVIGDFLFSASQGRARNRMAASVNAERINNSDWRTPAVISSNTSYVEVLQAEGGANDGQLARLIEIPIEASRGMTAEEAREIFGKLNQHYGLAAEPFIQYIIQNLDVVRQRMSAEQASLDKEAGFSSRERYWSIGFSHAIVAGQIACEVGLLDFDMDKLKMWIINFVKRMSVGVQFITERSEEDILGDFISENTSNTLVIDSSNTAIQIPIITPKNHLAVRYETKTNTLYLHSPTFRTYCRERNINVADFLKSSKMANVFRGTKSVRMASGTSYPSMPSQALMFVLPPEVVPVVGANIDESKDKS